MSVPQNRTPIKRTNAERPIRAIRSILGDRIKIRFRAISDCGIKEMQTSSSIIILNQLSKVPRIWFYQHTLPAMLQNIGPDWVTSNSIISPNLNE